MTVFPDSDHGNPLIIARVIEEIQFTLSQGKKNCYFVELDPYFQKSINQFLSNRATYEDSFLKAWGEYTEKYGFKNAKNILPKSLLTFLKEREISVYTADISRQSQVGWQTIAIIKKMEAERIKQGAYSPETWNEYVHIMIAVRNEEISRNVISRIQNERCEQSYFLIGNAHTKSEIPRYEGSVVPVQDLLMQSGLLTQVGLKEP
ncbi:hypothetical protein [Bdellovibrio bacteriovorus]|uniref:hypothetical protein n=1 Tax=Bdellovibrio TaxID=958 RepID=UPI0035A8234A